MGVPSAPNATGAVLAMRDNPEADSGEKPRPIRMAAVTATGVPKPAAPSKKAPKQKAMSSSCRRRVLCDAGQAVLEDLEQPPLLRQAVKKDDVEDDPADGEQPVGRAEKSHGPGFARRHAKGQDGDEERRGQAEQGGQVRLNPEEGERAEQDDDGESGEQSGRDPTAQRVVGLTPGHRSGLSLGLDYTGLA